MRSLTGQTGLVEQAYDAILEAICDGQLAPRERLTQERIAENLAVSRQPVGQALSLLKAQGFVRDAGRRGVMVAPVERKFVQAFYEFRGAVDALAATTGAGRSSDTLGARGRAIIAEGRAATSTGPVGALAAADMAFHKWLYEVAGNPIVIDAMNHTWHHGRRAMSAVIGLDEDWPVRIWDEHEAILEAVLEGDALRAGELARAHVRNAATALIERLPNDD
jgi:DNA-binding GntR family transcriptional regulator